MEKVSIEHLGPFEIKQAEAQAPTTQDDQRSK
jgi:hypothetical protein